MLTMAVSLLFLSSGNAAGFDYLLTFDTPQFDPNFNAVTLAADFTPPGVGYSTTSHDGVLDLAKVAGAGNGDALLTSKFQITGDFKLAVRGDRTDIGQGEAGLLVYLPHGFFDVFFSSQNQIGSVIVDPPVPDQSASLNLATTVVDFELRRTGSTLAAFANGTQVLAASHPDYAAPVSFGIFSLQVHFFSGATSARFDNFTIEADGVIPLLRIEKSGADVLLRWPAAARGFVLQYAADLGPGSPWTNLTAPTETLGQDSVARVASSESFQFFRLALP